MTNQNTASDPFKEFLSEEDYAILQDIQKRFIEKFNQYQPPSGSIPEDILNQDNDNPYAYDLVNTPNHISDQDRELIFYVRAELSTIDYQNQKYISLDQCYNESYHLPVPSGVDFNKPLKDFIETFEKDITIFGKKINSTNE